MPHIPDHATHDQELVAAYAAGDATGADLETATALVAACPECAALHHDLRLIAAALPELRAPVRPRDFRLTPAQAASLRPAGWRRLLGTLAGPSFRFAAPLGTGLAALGLAGILVGSLSGVPLGMGGAASTTRDTFGSGAAGAAAAPEQATAAPSAADMVIGQAKASPAPAATGEPGAAIGPADGSGPAVDTGPTPLLVLSLVSVTGGAVLLVGRLLSRRLAR